MNFVKKKKYWHENKELCSEDVALAPSYAHSVMFVVVVVYLLFVVYGHLILLIPVVISPVDGPF